jgi:hypothetical protein
MRSVATFTAATLWLASLAVTADAREIKKASPPAPKAETCSGDFGTSILFEDSPSEAAKKALKEEKLVLILHVSGQFEDPKLT